MKKGTVKNYILGDYKKTLIFSFVLNYNKKVKKYYNFIKDFTIILLDSMIDYFRQLFI